MFAVEGVDATASLRIGFFKDQSSGEDAFVDLRFRYEGASRAPGGTMVVEPSPAQCVLENAPELTLEQPVLVTELLFFAERDCIIGLLAPRSLWPVHAGRIIFSLERFR